MFNNLKPKISVSENLLCGSANDKSLLTNNFSSSFHTPYEIFRNNTTAVEVIVKQIKHKGKGQVITNIDKKDQDHTETATIKRLDGDIKKLKSELHEANSNLEEAQRCFKVILCEMKKQLEGANQRELQTQTENLLLQLEKEKLRTLLDSKSKLVTKLKKEFNAMRRMLKIVTKGIRCTPPCPENVYYSDIEYNEFKKDLRNSAFITEPGNSLENDSGLERIMASK